MFPINTYEPEGMFVHCMHTTCICSKSHQNENPPKNYHLCTTGQSNKRNYSDIQPCMNNNITHSNHYYAMAYKMHTCFSSKCHTERNQPGGAHTTGNKHHQQRLPPIPTLIDGQQNIHIAMQLYGRNHPHDPLLLQAGKEVLHP